MVGVGADGFPLNKKADGFQLAIQLLNMGGVVNKQEWTWRVFGLSEGESGEVTKALMNRFTAKVEEIESNGIVIMGENFTFKFVAKADQAWHHKLMAMGGCGSKFFSVFYNVSKETAKLYDLASRTVRDAVVKEW